MFQFDTNTLKEFAADALRYGASLGASAMAVEISENSGLNVTVRKRDVETIEQTRDKSLSVRAYIGKRSGSASTSDFSVRSIHEAVSAAYEIARFTAGDPAAGLPDRETLARNVPALDLYHPWDLTAEQAIQIAKEAEGAALGVDRAIGNSDGASVSTGQGQFVMANSLGFNNGYPYSRHSISCTPIAKHKDDMQRDYWYSVNCVPDELADPVAIGEYAARRALARLGARRLPTQKARVLFEAPLACGILGHLAQAVSGGALYRKSSFLLDSLGEQIFPSHVSVVEDPHVKRNLGSAPFDGEGVRTKRRLVVDQGELKGYFLSTYSARKLKMQTTGNAGGSHFMTLDSARTAPSDSLQEMLKKLGTGLFITELMGQGVNYVTGDYSRGASGYWVEKGEIQFPVEEITIAANMRDMFSNIEAIGADVLQRGGKSTGSVLISEMSIAGT
ncbi:MAG: metalloprotease PmbA [Burkholderiaceae bacterium]